MVASELILSVVSLAVIFGLIIGYYAQAKKRDPSNRESAFAGLAWLCILAIGALLYFVSFTRMPMALGQTEFSFYASAAASSVAASLRMFVFLFEYDIVMDMANTNTIEGYLYCAAVVACFLAAAFWSIIMAKNIVFKGLSNNFALWYRRNISSRLGKRKRYIIIGFGKPMQAFLKNLETSSKTESSDKRVRKKDIIIITGESQNIADTYAHYRAFISRGYVTINGRADENALVRAGINNVRRKTIVVSMAEDDQQNIAVAYIAARKVFSSLFPGEEFDNKDFLKKIVGYLSFRPHDENNMSADEEEKWKKRKSIEKDLDNINLEAHIMYSFIERTEHFAFAENAYGKVDFFNPYEMRARDFFNDNPITGFIPWLIDTGKARLKGEYRGGKIYRPKGLGEEDAHYKIKNIFVGFGVSNSQMLKWSVLTGQLLGCDYNAKVFDENTTEEKPSVRESMFKNHSPGLFKSLETVKAGEEITDSDGKRSIVKYFKSPDENYEIDFENGNVLSRDFYEKLMDEVDGNDFTAIYVALGDDKLGIETACEIRQWLFEKFSFKIGKNPDIIKIFVKIKERTVMSKDSVLNNEQNIPIRIECYGEDDTVFTEKNIVGESLDRLAQTVSNKHHKTAWGILSETKRDSNRQVAIAVRVKLNLLGFDIVEPQKTDKEQDAEALARTEEEYEKAYGLNENVKDILSDGRHIDYLEKDQDGSISDNPRNNLARFEHVRWNTFQIVQGWTKKPRNLVGAGNDDRHGTDNTGRQNRLTKQHACITTFEELVSLRELQAAKLREEKPCLTPEEAEKKADTIYYDFNTMDELVKNMREGRGQTPPVSYYIIRK